MTDNKTDDINQDIATDKFNEKIVRWQARLLDERGKLISLLLALSLGTIAFLINQIISNSEPKQPDPLGILGNTPKECWSKCLMTLGLIMLLSCVVIALYVSLNRLDGIRKTMSVIKAKRDKKTIEEITKLEIESDNTDSVTLKWFSILVWIFGIAEVLVIIGFFIKHSAIFF